MQCKVWWQATGSFHLSRVLVLTTEFGNKLCGRLWWTDLISKHGTSLLVLFFFVFFLSWSFSFWEVRRGCSTGLLESQGKQCRAHILRGGLSFWWTWGEALGVSTCVESSMLSQQRSTTYLQLGVGVKCQMCFSCLCRYPQGAFLWW